MQVAIIEDEQIHIDLLEGYLNAWSRERKTDITVHPFLSAESFLFQWEDFPELDVLFVDIQMERMNGMEMARAVRQKNRDVAIVFTTGITDYMEDGYEVEALHYLLKPIREEKVFLCMDKAAGRRRKGSFILINGKEGACRLDVDEIDCVEAMGHGTALLLADRRRVEATDSIAGLERKLEKESFVKSHRSYLCNLTNIRRMDKDTVYFDSGNQVPISRRMYQEVNRAFIQRYRGERKP